MNRSDDKPEASATPGPGAEPAGAFPEASDDEAIVDHDPTLRWVLSDYDAPMNVTPPPVTPPLQPVPMEWSAPTLPAFPPSTPPPPTLSAPVLPAVSADEVEAAFAAVRQSAAVPVPPAFSAPPLEFDPLEHIPTPPPLAREAFPTAEVFPEAVDITPVVASPPSPKTPAPTSGATPAAPFTIEPTPPSPTEIIADILAGAAPVAESSAPASDADLSAEAVEETPPAETSVAPPVVAGQSVSSTMPNDVLEEETPVLPAGAEVPIVVEAAAPESTTEPREVEPEAVEMLESAEHPTAPEEASAATPAREATPAAVAATSVTPPPVPVEAALRTPAPAVALATTPPPLHVETAAPAATLASTPPPVPIEAAIRTPAPVTTPPPVRVESAPHASPPPPTAGIAAALFDEFQTPTSGEDIPEALARRSLKKKAKPWFEEVFDEDFLRTLPFTTPEQTAREIAFIRQTLSPPKDAELLDVGCGFGRHALELASAGYKMTGLDLSLPMLIRAADHAQKRGLTVNFVHADMREMTFNSQFHGAYCMLSSFGYFDEETNLRVASAICRALKPGGKFLLDILNRDYIVGDLPSRVWWEGDGCVVLEEVDFNYHTSRVLIRRSVVFGNGRQTEQEISLRAYSLHEVGKLLRHAGLRVLDVSGSLATKSRFFGAASRNIIALCERPAP